jgi:hypothetical protein
MALLWNLLNEVAPLADEELEQVASTVFKLCYSQNSSFYFITLSQKHSGFHNLL